MPVPASFVRHQGPMLKALGKVALSALRGPDAESAPHTPGPKTTAEVPPRSDELIDAYAKWCGAPASRYAGTVPPHLFPQWGFPLLGQALGDLPYKLTGVLNQGCRVRSLAPLPRGESLQLTGWLEDVADDGNKARIHQRLVTGTDSVAEAVVADVYAVVLLGKGGGGKKKDKPAEDLSGFEEAGRWQAGAKAGRDFALLTGDFNPIHWVAPYAKLAGFPNTILHGFGSFALSYEALQSHLGADIRDMDVRFTRPLVLPADCRVLYKSGTKTKPGQVRLLDAKDKVCMAGTVALA